MPETAKVAIGTVWKTHGLKGNFKIKLYQNIEALQQSEVLFFEEDHHLIPYFLTSWQLLPNHILLVKLEDFNSKESAAGMLKKRVFSYDDLVEFRKEEKAAQDILGYWLIDQHGQRIGKIQEIIPLPQNPVLSVERKSGETLIPFQTTFILKISTEDKELHMNLPKGILEL